LTPLDKIPPAAQWTLLVAVSVALSAVLFWLGIPAALFLGPMVTGIAVTAAGGRIDVPSWVFVLAQGLIGCMIARMLPASVGGSILAHWPTFLLGVLSVIAACGALGWIMSRSGMMPGTTVVWGLSPGAATAMIVMSEIYGADTQLVALMQYLRLVIVASVASVVARLAGIGMGHAPSHPVWLQAVAWVPLAETLVLAALGPLAAQFFRMPMLSLMLPLAGGVFLEHQGLLHIETPQWLLALGYAFVGWRVGLRFSRPLLRHAARLLPRMIACTFALIAVCGLLGALMSIWAGVDPLTAYLATSPGGADSVAIIAASSNVDASFVMAMQTMRFIGVLFLGPPMARFVAARLGATARRR
jgi:membrane AbrB-like protein